MFTVEISALRKALKNSFTSKTSYAMECVTFESFADRVHISAFSGSDNSNYDNVFSTFRIQAVDDGKDMFCINGFELLEFLGKTRKANVLFTDCGEFVTAEYNGAKRDFGKTEHYAQLPELYGEELVENVYLPKHLHEAFEYCKHATNTKDKIKPVFGYILAAKDCFVATDSFRVHKYEIPNHDKHEIMIPPSLWKAHKVFDDKNELIHVSKDSEYVSIRQGDNEIIARNHNLNYPDLAKIFNILVTGYREIDVQQFRDKLEICSGTFIQRHAKFYDVKDGKILWECDNGWTKGSGPLISFGIDKRYALKAVDGMKDVEVRFHGEKRPILFIDKESSRVALVMPLRYDESVFDTPKPEEPVSEPVESVEVEEPVEIRSEEPEQVEEPVTADPEPEIAEEPEEIDFDKLPDSVKAEIEELRAEYENKIAVLENAFNKITQKLRYTVDLGAMPHEELPEICDHHEGLDCCINGTWVWVWGDTKPIAKELKKNGFFWHNKRQMWYWNESFPQFVKEAFAA